MDGKIVKFILCSVVILTLGVAGGMIGSTGHYLSNRALRATDVSATQSIKFLDLVWSALAGLWVFGDVPTATTAAGAAVIFISTTWIARREARKP